MSKYGDAAVLAVRFIETGQSPRGAWDRAARETFGEGNTSAGKGCPRDAFLGLCQQGLVAGVPAGQYTKSRKNKRYTLKAARALSESPALAGNTVALWNVAAGGEKIAHNSQMDVVLSLWRSGLLVGGG